MTKKIYIASDHAGFALKKQLLAAAELAEYSFEDLGCESESSTDYPTWAQLLSEKVAKEKGRGILICGSGIGMSMAANRKAGVRAAAVSSETAARLSRQHNDANVLCLGARLVGIAVAVGICRVWLTTEFEGGRHEKRVQLIEKG